MADKKVITLKLTPEFLTKLDELEKVDIRTVREMKKRLVDENADQCVPCIVDPDMEEIVNVLGKDAIPILNKLWVDSSPKTVEEVTKEIAEKFPDKMDQLKRLAEKFRLSSVSK